MLRAFGHSVWTRCIGHFQAWPNNTQNVAIRRKRVAKWCWDILRWNFEIVWSAQPCDDHPLYIFFLQFKFKIFHTFSYFVHQLRLSCELTSWPAPSWLDSSVGRELGKTQAWKYRLTLSGSVLRELVLTIDFAFLMSVLSEDKLY